MECKYCGVKCQKAGKQKNGCQKFYCMHCKKYQQKEYQYHAYNPGITAMIPKLVCNSVGINSIARILQVAVNTVMKRIKIIAASISRPLLPLNRKAFEMDELRTYIHRKENQYWVAYAICSETKKVLDFIVGKRSKRTLRILVNSMLLSGVATIKTDRLNIYQSLIPKDRHVNAAYNINHIERNNLNLRTHLKRLSRRTICYSKSFAMLCACLKIYFWYTNTL